jgi:hypothetical protein
MKIIPGIRNQESRKKRRERKRIRKKETSIKTGFLSVKIRVDLLENYQFKRLIVQKENSTSELLTRHPEPV